MKIVIAPDSFKGSVSATRAAEAMVAGVRRAAPGAELVLVPMADGGEGTVEALVQATGGQIRRAEVCGPLGEKVRAKYGVLGGGRTAVVEMAEAAGLPLVAAERRNPLDTTTYGVGELILAGWGEGCREFLIGVGGSATNDCGTGMAQALGVRFFDGQGREIRERMTGRWMGEVYRVERSGVHVCVREGRFRVACDVTNPLLGEAGASRVYSPQKGAGPADTELLERNMERVIGVIEREMGRQFRDVPGAGAAGGLACGLMAFAGAHLERGIEIVLRQVGFAEKIRGADLILTGEGQVDGSTAYGKTIAGIAAEARKQGVPVVALAGSIGRDAHKVYEAGVTAMVGICRGPMELGEAMRQGEVLLAEAAENVVRIYASRGEKSKK